MKAYLKDIRMALAAMMLLVSAAWGAEGRAPRKQFCGIRSFGEPAIWGSGLKNGFCAIC